MRRYALVCAILGLFLLVVLSIFTQPVEVYSYKDLNGLEENTLVHFIATLDSQKVLWKGTNRLQFENNITALCIRCKDFSFGDEIEVYGLISVYDKSYEIILLKVTLRT